MSTLNLVALTLTEIIGDFGFEKFADTGKISGFFQGGIGYIGVIFFLIRSLSGANVMFVNGMWDGISGIIESLAAYILLGERLDSWVQYLGILLISLGLVFLKAFGGTGNKK